MKDGKLFGLINPLDLLIVIVIIAAAAIIAPNFIGSTKIVEGVDSNTTVYFTIEFPQTTQNFADKITVGDLIKDNARNYYYGVAEKVEVVPALLIRDNALDGIFVESEVPDKVNVLMTVKCNGSETEDDILAEGHPIKIGMSMLLKGKGYAAAGYVVALRTEKGAAQ